MSSDTIELNKSLRDYLIASSVKESKVLRDLRKETSTLDESQMQISPEQGTFLSFLVGLLSARYTLDIGVFTGYSSLVVALQLPQDGFVTACDTNIDWTDIAKKYWKMANVEKKIKFHLAPAIQTLDTLIADGKEEMYYFFLIYGDKIFFQ